MKFLFYLLMMVFPFVLYGQSDGDFVWKEPSQESQNYHVYRTAMAWPPYGLAKVTELIGKIEFDEENEAEALDKAIYEGLTLREKFTYNMIHPESYSQVCDALPPILDEHKKIFGHLPDVFGEYNWSSRQKKFFKDNRDTVMDLIIHAVLKSKRIEANYKHAIVEINGVELIPFLVEIYKMNKKDHDILTVLLLLMENNNYPPFKSSLSHRKLYGADADYRSHLVFNSANEALVIQRATDFSRGWKK